MKIISTNQRIALNSQLQSCLLIDWMKDRKSDFSLYNRTTVQRKDNRCSKIKVSKFRREKRDSCPTWLWTRAPRCCTVVRSYEWATKEKADVLGLSPKDILTVHVQLDWGGDGHRDVVVGGLTREDGMEVGTFEVFEAQLVFGLERGLIAIGGIK